MIPRPQGPTLFPYTTLFRSPSCAGPGGGARFIRLFETDVSFPQGDRKSTRLNSSHQIISYAVFCLKKKNIDTLTFAANRLEAIYDHPIALLVCFGYTASLLS